MRSHLKSKFKSRIMDTIGTKRMVIGLMGIQKGVGVTHTGLLIGAYITEVLGLNAALLDMSDNDDFQLLERQAVTDNSVSSHFRLLDISFFKEVKPESLLILLHLDYEYFLIDFGCEHKKHMREFLRCDYSIVIGSLSLWKKSHYYEFIETSQCQMPNHKLFYVAVFGQGSDCRQIKRKFSIPVYSLGYEPDPLNPSIAARKLFRKIIG